MEEENYAAVGQVYEALATATVCDITGTPATTTFRPLRGRRPSSGSSVGWTLVVSGIEICRDTSGCRTEARNALYREYDPKTGEVEKETR